MAATSSVCRANFVFIEVDGNSTYFTKVESVFRDVLEPLYGDQSKMISQIKLCSDRQCELLIADENPVGLIVYKKALQDEFAEFGVENSLELKTLLLIDAKKNSGKGFGTTLINRVIEVARKKHSNGVHVTVSEEVKTSKRFFSNKNFEIVHTWDGRYKPDSQEFLFFLRLAS